MKINKHNYINAPISTEKANCNFKMLCFSMILCLFLGYFMWGETMWPDSPGYINMSLSRNYGYPLVLALFRSIFGETNYLFAVSLFQIILLGYGAWSLSEYVVKSMEMPKVYEIFFIIGMQSFILVMPVILSESAVSIAYAILTEGMTIPLYFLFIQYTLQALILKSLRPLWISGAIAFIGVGMRGQLLFMPIILLIVAVWLTVETKKMRKYWVGVLTAFILFFSFSNLCTYTYHYIKHGVFTDTPFMKVTLLTRVLYDSDLDDVNLFENEPELQLIYNRVMEKNIAEGWNYSSAGKGFINQLNNFENSYDQILYNNLYDTIVEVNDIEMRGEQRMLLESDVVAGKMFWPLFIDNFAQFIKTSWNSFIAGMVRSVSIIIPSLGTTLLQYIMIGWSALLYFASILLSILAIRRNTDSKGARFMVLMLLVTLGTVAIPALSLMTLSRYTIYNMAPFYVAGVCILYELFLKELILKRRKT